MSEAQEPTSEIGRRIANLTPEQRLILERRLSRAQAARQERPAAAIPRREETGPAPLSFSQERLWFLEQLHPGTALYAMPVAVRLAGPLSPGALKRSLAEIVRRHEALRTTFRAWRGEPRQEVAPPGPPELTWIDLRLIDPSLREAEASARMEEEASRPFHLETGPLLRTTVLRLGAEEHLLLLVLHHIVADGWSLGVLVRELAFLYGGFVAGEEPRLPELPLQVADFAAWQRRWLAGSELEDRLGYWRRQLAGAPTNLELPADRPRPAAPTFAGASRPFRLRSLLAERLAALARERGATLYMVLLAAFDVLLWRYTGQEDLLVASPVANRNRTEVEGLIGFFTNTLVLRARLDGGISFAELLQRVRSTALDAQAHQDLPFERLVEELQPERSLIQNPLVQVMFALQNAPLPPMSMGGLELRQVELPSRTAKFDLLFELHPDGDSLAGNVEHSAELFDGSTLERWIGTFERILEGAVASPEARLEDLPVLDPAQMRQILGEWNGSPGVEPRAVLERFAEQVERTPGATALVDWKGGRLSYRELDESSARLARLLRGRGVGLETSVGILMERSLETVVAVVAVLRAGGAYLPLDPSYPDERLAFMVRDARPAVLLTQESLAHRVPEGAPEVIRLDQLDQENLDGLELAVPSPDALAYLIYTSGSTGTPKGVAMRHGPLSNLLEWQLADLPGAARTLQFTPLSFDVSFQEIFSTLISGGTLVVVPDDLRRDPDALWRFLGEHQVERLFLPFVALQQLAAAAARDLDSVAVSLREIVTAGEQLQVTPLVAALLERIGGRLDNQYGPTETHVVTRHTLTGSPAEWPALPPIGLPIDQGEALVLDRSLRPVPLGGIGEVFLGGATLARGYHGRGDLTAERFLPHPFARTAGARVYRTGDLARQLPDGSLQFLGRSDHQVKIRGFRVDLAEIEAVLLSHPRVVRAAVALKDGRLVAWVVPDAPRDGTADELRVFLRGLLPEYMVPQGMVLLDALPLTPSGKVDRRALAASDLSGEVEGTADVGGFASPAEEILAGIWSEVLGRPVAGSESHFFELGGHSLLATQVVSRVRDVFQAALPVRDLFAHPTVAALARRIETARLDGSAGEAPPVRPVQRDRDLPLSFGQERLWFLEQLHPGSPLYHLPASLEVQGRLRPEVLAGSLAALVRRHEALRTTFRTAGGRAVQVVEPPFDVPLPVVDLGGLEAARQAEESRRLASEAVRRPFDLERGPLFRAELVRLAPESHLLLLCFHHMVADGWSMGPLVREIAMGCAALAEGRLPSLPDLPVQVPDFATWQRERLSGEVLEEELRYWRRQLAGAPPVLEVPTDRPRPAVPSFRGANHRFSLPAELTGRLGAVGRRQGATLFMTLAAGLSTLLGRISCQEELTLGTPIANRQRPELEGLVGLLMNMLALRVDLAGDPPFSGLLSRVRAVTLGAYDHQDLPFEKLVEEVVDQRNLEVSPVFQVLLALQNAPRTALDLPGLRVIPRAVDTGTAKFDLSFYLEDDGGGGLDGVLEHSLDLFDRSTAARLARQLGTLLTAVAEAPERPLAGLPLLDEAERHQLLVEGNDTVMPLPPVAAVHALFDAQVARTPDAEAVVCGDAVLTYAELGRRADALARHLRSLGVGPDRRVGLLLGRSEDMVTAMLAVLKAGGAYLPLDPAYPADRLAFMAEDAGLALLLTETPLAGLLSGVVPEDRTVLLDAGPLEGGTDLHPDAGPENLAYVIYTSGSTGRPKGVLVTHGAVLNFFAGMDDVLGAGPEPGDTWLAVTSISFDISVLELLWTLCRGFRVVVQAPSSTSAVSPAPAKPLDFSLFYFASESAGEEKGRDRYRLLLDGARFADRHGFSAVWTPERHFHSFGGLYPNPSVAGAALAVATERIEIRAGSVVLPLQSPLRVAEEWSVVDNLSNGRVGISFASGWHADDFVLAPDRYQDRRAIMFRDLELVRRLWRGGKVSLPNGAGQPAEVGIYPPPVQSELPFWITAGGSPETFRMAGEAGGHLLTHLLGQSVHELAEKVAVYREARRRAGHAGPGRVSLMIHTFVGDDLARVRDTVWGPFRAYLASSVDLIANLGRSMGMDVRSQGFTQEDMDALLDHACERYFHESALFGTPESCLANVERFLAAGVDELACLIDFGIPAGEVLASLERLDELRRRSQVRAEAVATTSDIGAEPVPVPLLARQHGVTHLQCTPSMAKMLISTPDGREALGALRTLLVGGEALPESLAQELLEMVPGRVLNMYGPTETTVWSACQPVRGDGPVTVGRPIANTEVHVLDPALERVPLGVPGEVYLGGLGVTRGYHQRPDLTAERFVPDPFDRRTGGRLYRTGDRARTRPDGTLEFLGRLDHQVKLRGYRIELGEIEAALAAHAAVREAVVVARQDGGAEPQLVGYVVPATAPALELRLAPEERLAGLPSYRWPNGMVISHLSDFQAGQLYEEVFRDRLYLRYGVTLRDGDCVFDVGANIGTFTLFANTQARDLKVFSFEPIPPTFQALKANAELYGLDARVFNCGVSRRPEVADFTFYPEMAGLSSRYSNAEKDRRMTRAIIQDGLKDGGLGADEIEEWLDDRFRSETHRCELRPLTDVIAEHGVERIDLLKVDVERAELDVLAGLSDEDWTKIRQVVLEVDGRDNLREVKAILEARGFQVAVDDLVVVAGEGDDDVAVYMVYARREALDFSAVKPGPEPAGGDLASVLRGALRESLPDYMVPAAFVVLDRFPLTPNGKIDRRALPAPGGRSSRVRGTYKAPDSEMEKSLAEIWREVLRVDRVGLEDNFFELGGSSLMVVQVRSAIKERTGMDVSLVELFRSPTIALLSRSLERGKEAAPASFEEVRSRSDMQKAARDRRRNVAQRTRGQR